ncbi:MAG: hypothetical protein ABIN91_15255 [Mucilaginibacter sp.]|uniref:hypothetical protein n=1 Tax=Mucilaginibacter sp. TaxID=1882438 RepID=UPI003264FA5F
MNMLRQAPRQVTIYQKETTSSPDAKITLKLYLSEAYSYVTKPTLFNQQLEKIPEISDELITPNLPDSGVVWTYKIDAAFYTLRLEINGRIADYPLALQSDYACSVGFMNGQQPVNKTLVAPEVYSSALLGGEVRFASSHEYYTEPAVRISELDTFENWDQLGHDCGLLIFLRYPSKESYRIRYERKSYWERFTLLDYLGRPFVSFPNHCLLDTNTHDWNWEHNSGYIGFSAKLRPGLYFLQYDDPVEPRTIPVYVYKRWYTQFFMTVADKPLYGSIRMLLSKQRRFDHQNKYHYYTDVLLNKLLNGSFTLNDHLLHQIAYGKWEAPMVGLLGAYIYLKSKQTKNDLLFKTIVDNLQYNILAGGEGSPDIWGLNMLTYQHFKTTISLDQAGKLKGLPMLRVAFDAIREAAAIYPWLIEEGGLKDHVTEQQVFDSPYTVFRSLPAQVFTQLLTEDYNKVKSSKNLKTELDDSQRKLAPVVQEIAISDKKIGSPVKDKLKRLMENKNEVGWLGGSIISLLLQDEYLGNEQLAETLSVSAHTVTRIRKQLGI